MMHGGWKAQRLETLKVANWRSTPLAPCLQSTLRLIVPQEPTRLACLNTKHASVFRRSQLTRTGQNHWLYAPAAFLNTLTIFAEAIYICCNIVREECVYFDYCRFCNNSWWILPRKASVGLYFDREIFFCRLSLRFVVIGGVTMPWFVDLNRLLALNCAWESFSLRIRLWYVKRDLCYPLVAAKSTTSR